MSVPESNGLVDPLKKCATSATCLWSGHDIIDNGLRDDNTRERFLGGHRGKVREYFKGNLLYCARHVCKWQHFVGEKEAWKVSIISEKGVEEIIEERM